MSSLCLSAEEIAELTGRPRTREQTRWLRERGYPYELGDDGVPKVLRAYVMQRLGGKIEAQPSRPQIRMP